MHDLFINQGDDYELVLNITGVNNIKSCKFRFGARYTPSDKQLALSKECSVLDDGAVMLTLSGKDTGNLIAANPDYKYNKMYYDVQMVVNGIAKRILEGKIYISPGNAYKVEQGKHKPFIWVVTAPQLIYCTTGKRFMRAYRRIFADV